MTSSSGFDRLVTIIGAFSAIAIVLLTSLRQVDTPDIFSHIALGERVLSGEWPPVLSNLYFTPIASGWEADFRNTFLGDVALAGVDRLAGLAGVQILCLVLLFASAVLLWRSAAPESIGRQRWPSLPMWFLAAVLGFATLQLQAPRNAVFSLLFVPLVLIGGDRYLQRGNLKLLAGVALLFAVWTTIHASYLLGLVLIAAQAVGSLLDARLSRRSLSLFTRRIFLLLAAMGAVCLPGNPHLLHYFALPAYRMSVEFAGEGSASPSMDASDLKSAPKRQYRVPASLRDSHPESVAEAESTPEISPAAKLVSRHQSAPKLRSPDPSFFDRSVAVLFQPIWKSSGDELISGDFLPSWKSLRYLPVSVALLLARIFHGWIRRWCLEGMGGREVDGRDDFRVVGGV